MGDFEGSLRRSAEGKNCMKINHPADQHSKIYPAFIGGGAFNGMAAIEILLYISLLLVFCNAVFKKKELNF